jgi:hypothetical protein
LRDVVAIRFGYLLHDLGRRQPNLTEVHRDWFHQGVYQLQHTLSGESSCVHNAVNGKEGSQSLFRYLINGMPKASIQAKWNS